MDYLNKNFFINILIFLNYEFWNKLLKKMGEWVANVVERTILE